MPTRILVVDDDIAYLEVIQHALVSQGYEVTTATTGMHGLKLAREEKPDILLLDIMMPRMHGFEVCHQLRADKGMAGLKIIMISAKGYKSDFDAAMNAGADSYLVKPFKPEALLELLEQFAPSSRTTP